MALRIISANEPMKVDQLVVTIYGQPGVGKTSLGFTAESPLLLDFDIMALTGLWDERIRWMCRHGLM